MKHIVRKVLEILGKHRTKEVHVLIDIDGVLNFEDLLIDDEVKTIHSLSGKWTIRKEVLDWLEQLSKEQKVKFHWFSTWGNESNIINSYIGISDFDVIEISKTKPVESKVEALGELIHSLSEKTVIVVNDLFASEHFDWYLTRSYDETKSMFNEWENIRRASIENLVEVHFIAPDSRVGLVKEEMKFINDVVESVKFEKE